MTILDLYRSLDTNRRFVSEVFDAEIYKEVCPQLNIIDAGAYEGEFSFYALLFANKILAYEPDPAPYKVLSKHIKKHNLSDKIKHFDIALSDTNSTAIIANTGDGGSQMADSGDGVQVVTQTLATAMRENNMEFVDILKIDIESSEDRVFRAKDFPGVADKINLIIGEHLSGVSDILTELGFQREEYTHGLIFRR